MLNCADLASILRKNFDLKNVTLCDLKIPLYRIDIKLSQMKNEQKKKTQQSYIKYMNLTTEEKKTNFHQNKTKNTFSLFLSPFLSPKTVCQVQQICENTEADKGE